MAKKPEKKVPATLAKLLKSKEYLPKFEAFCKKEHSLDNYTFLTLKSWNAQNLYKVYLSPTAKYELNISSDTINEARALGEKKAWDDRAWNKIYDDAQETIGKLVSRDSFKRFIVSLEEEE